LPWFLPPGWEARLNGSQGWPPLQAREPAGIAALDIRRLNH